MAGRPAIYNKGVKFISGKIVRDANVKVKFDEGGICYCIFKVSKKFNPELFDKEGRFDVKKLINIRVFSKCRNVKFENAMRKIGIIDIEHPITMGKEHKCVRCDKVKKDVKRRLDPFDLDVHGKKVLRWLCDDCDKELADEI
jgi:hypothetical protein